MRKLASLISVISLIALPLPAFADDGHVHAGDIEVGVADGRIFTHDRVYGLELGEDVPDVADLGFDSEAGTFPVPGKVGFDILDALRVWDGGSFDTIAAPTMTLSYSTLSATTPATAGQVVSGFDLAADAVNSPGKWHRHLAAALDAPATDGIYLLMLQLHSTADGIQPSLPFWVVFNQNGDEAAHEAAEEYARTALVPEPTGLALLGIGSLIALRRRR